MAHIEEPALDPRQGDPTGGDLLDAWQRESAAKQASLQQRGIHVAAGARMAREQPAQHFLYGAIDAMNSTLDKQAVRQRLGESRTRKADDARRIAVPGAIVNCTSITEETGTTFHSGTA